MIQRADTLEGVRPLTQDERRALWSAKYYAAGYHHTPELDADTRTDEETEQ